MNWAETRRQLQRAMTRDCLWLILVLAMTAPCFANEQQTASLHSDAPFSSHVHRHFRVREGLPSNWIYALAQSRDGYVWIGTHNGVARYDGTRFQILRRSNTPELPANDTRSLFAAKDGGVWIGTVGGLARYQPGRPGSFESFKSFKGNSVHAIFQDSTGKLWFGTREETWVRLGDEDFAIAERAPRNVKAICEDASGRLWFGTDNALYRLVEGACEQIVHPRIEALLNETDVSTVGVRTLLADDTGIWVGCSHFIVRFEGESTPSKGDEVGMLRCNDLYRTRDGAVYAATSSGLFRSVDGGAFAKVHEVPRAYCVLEDREGGFWLGHTVNLALDYFRNSKVRATLGELRINCIYQSPASSDVWIGATNGLHRWRNGELTNYGETDALLADSIESMAPGPDGSLWVSTKKGLMAWTPEHGAEFRFSELSGVAVRNVFVDSHGVIWASFFYGGACKVVDGVVTPLPELDHGTVAWIQEDKQGRHWIGHEYGLFRYEGGRVKQVLDPAFEQLNSRHFTCCHASKDGSLWMGTTGGIVLYQSGRFAVVTSEHGLATDFMDRIFEDAHGFFWIGGREGYSYVRGDELRRAASESRVVLSHRVEPVNGIPMTRSHPKGFLSPDGTLWMIGNRGLIQVPSEPMVKPVAPLVALEHVRLDGDMLKSDERFEFLSGRHRLAITFAAPTFFNPHDVHIRYRLDGYDDDWVDAGQERVAYYTDLAPRSYRFQVTAANGTAWNDSGAEISIIVQPRWWERIETKVVLGVLFVFLGLAFVRYRTQSYRRANAILRREIADRKRAEDEARHRQAELARVTRAGSMGEMATTIAHEVRQPLFAMMTDAETVARLLQQEELDREQLQDAVVGISQGGARASEIIDRIRSLVSKEPQPKKQLDLNQVARAAIDFLQPEFRKRSITVELNLAHDLPTVDGNEIELQQVVLNLLINGAQAMNENEKASRRLLVQTDRRNDAVELAVWKDSDKLMP